jgi:hypothetical protein
MGGGALLFFEALQKIRIELAFDSALAPCLPHDDHQGVSASDPGGSLNTHIYCWSSRAICSCSEVYNPSDDSPQHLASQKASQSDDDAHGEDTEDEDEWEASQEKAPPRSSKKKTPQSKKQVRIWNSRDYTYKHAPIFYLRL